MNLDVHFVYYRNFRFDGKFHVRCIGAGLEKVKSIRYELEKSGPDGPRQVDAMSVYSQAQSGVLSDHGCPALLRCDVAAGTYTIKPRVTLREGVADVTVDGSGAVVVAALQVVIDEGELSRGYSTLFLCQVQRPGGGVRLPMNLQSIWRARRPGWSTRTLKRWSHFLICRPARLIRRYWSNSSRAASTDCWLSWSQAQARDWSACGQHSSQ